MKNVFISRKYINQNIVHYDFFWFFFIFLAKASSVTMTTCLLKLSIDQSTFRFLCNWRSVYCKRVLQRSEKVIIRRSQVWRISWMRENFSFELQALFFSSCNMWSCVIMQKNHFASNTSYWWSFSHPFIVSIDIIAVGSGQPFQRF